MFDREEKSAVKKISLDCKTIVKLNSRIIKHVFHHLNKMIKYTGKNFSLINQKPH